jgi:hypothetical protein
MTAKAELSKLSDLSFARAREDLIGRQVYARTHVSDAGIFY